MTPRSVVHGLASLLLLGASLAPAAVVEQWRWMPGADVAPFGASCSTPLVVPVADGGPLGCDSPSAVLVLTCDFDDPRFPCRVAVLDARDGALLDLLAPELSIMTPAVADLDGDGAVEVVGVGVDRDEVVAFELDGSLDWVSDPVGPLPVVTSAIALADLDEDGSAEVLVPGGTVLSSTGEVRWSAASDVDSSRFPIAADVRADSPGLEVVLGPQLLAADGAVLWRNDGVGSGLAAVADFGADEAPEIVLLTGSIFDPAAAREVVLLSADGVELAPRFPVAPWRLVPPPAAADLDGDGDAEAIVPGQRDLVTLDWDGVAWSLHWSRRTRDLSGGTGAVAFDFDGDGASDVAYQDEERFQLFDGPTGDVLVSLAQASGTGSETPAIADIDGDELTEIVVGTCSTSVAGSVDGVVVLEHEGGATARPLWTQHQYHVTHVADDGDVASEAPPPWRQGLGWLEQAAADCGCRTWLDLAEAVASADIARGGVRHSLDVKVSAACRAHERERDEPAGGILCAFLNEVDAQDGRHLAETSAEALRRCARELADAHALDLGPCEER